MVGGGGGVVVMVVAVDVLLSHGLHVDGCAGPGPLRPLFCPGTVRHTVWWVCRFVMVGGGGGGGGVVAMVDLLLPDGLHVDGRVGSGPLHPQFCPWSVQHMYGECGGWWWWRWWWWVVVVVW